MSDISKDAQIVLDKFEGMLLDAQKGLVKSEDLTAFLEQAKKENSDNKELISKMYDQIEKRVDAINKEMQAVVMEQKKVTEQKQSTTSKKITSKELAEKIFDSPQFSDFVKGGLKRSDKIEMKEVSLSGNYTGYANAPATLTFDTDIVSRYPYQIRPLRVRDVISSVPIDVPFIISEEIVDFVNNITNNSENGELTELDFTVNPLTVNKKRIGGHIKISKDMLQSRAFVVSEIERQLPLMYYYIEDDQLLNGSGIGDNVLGLFKNPRTRQLAGLTNTYIAASISSVADFGNGKVLITFAAAHNMFDNYKLTIANSTNYNATYNVSVHTETKVVVAATYVAEATAAWTGSSQSAFYQSVDNANTSDVISAGMRQLRQGYYVPSAIFINPSDSFGMERAKGTDAHYLGNVSRQNGVITVDGVPVVETDVVPVGKVYLADTLNAARIYDYKGLSMEMADDVQYKLKNQVALIIEAHVLMANFNPLMTMVVDIAGVRTDLETP